MLSRMCFRFIGKVRVLGIDLNAHSLAFKSIPEHLFFLGSTLSLHSVSAIAPNPFFLFRILIRVLRSAKPLDNPRHCLSL